jgi:transcription antitermination factor NusG
MSSLGITLENAPPILPLGLGASWYAVHTMARHEKRVAAQFQEKRICTFLPLHEQVHRWSDRRVRVDVPLFSCYAFVHITPTAYERVRVLRTPGVLGLVGSEGQGEPIPDEQIEGLQAAMREKLPVAERPFSRIGQQVRIRGGALNGVKGYLVREGKDQSFVISVVLLQRSVAIRFEGYQVEPA